MRSKKEVENLFIKGKHFCVLPWIHLHVTGYGYISPCCQQREGPNSKGYGSLNENSLPELWQGEAIRNFRLKMLADEWDERCLNCYENESVNQNTVRIFSNYDFRKYLPWVMDTDDTGYASQAKPIYWDLRFSNICNLKCRICNFSSSSSWHKDAQALGLVDSNTPGAVIHGLKSPAAFLSDLKQYYPEVDYIYFAGGEPLLFTENLSLLEDLNSLRRHRVKLRYSTNFTQLNPRVLELWKKFPKIELLISLDGSEERGEYQRKGLVWNEIIHNLDYVKKECPQVEIKIHFTVNAFNILHLPDFHREMVEKGYIKKVYKMYMNILHNPEYYNVKILPEELKKQATQKLKEHIAWLTNEKKPLLGAQKYQRLFVSQWYACTDYMNSEDWTHLIPKFIEVTNQLDQLRNEKCLEVFPELAPVFKNLLNTKNTKNMK
ncbi:MAG TPA: twitch domain-containing radical SAM protein [Bacillota bacterium]|nr:twitch domain-containing radical SAM protein [Bacillota bacterium]